VSAHARHKAARTTRWASRLLVVLAAAAVGGSLLTGGSSATYADTARASLNVMADGGFPCTTQVSAPFEFTQAPVDHGSGTWTRTSALCSPNRRWIAVFQVDGNVVLYDTTTTPGTAIWNTWTFGASWGGKGAHLIFQGDGNLVVYDAGFTALRHTGTSSIAQPARLALQDDGNLVIYDATGIPRWWSLGTQTADCRVPGTFTCNPNNAGWGS